MAGAWPWVAVAGIGALHGLNPATGWALAAAWGVKSGDRNQALRALVPIAVGHLASVALVAAVVVVSAAVGRAADLAALQAVAMLLLVIGTARCLTAKRMEARTRRTAGRAALAACSFVMSTVQGAGMMLVPALLPICTGDAAMREITSSGSLGLALLAVAVHATAMFVVSGLIATNATRWFVWIAARRSGIRSSHASAP